MQEQGLSVSLINKTQINIMTKSELIQELENIVGVKRIVTKISHTDYYRSGFRSGNGSALAG